MDFGDGPRVFDSCLPDKNIAHRIFSLRLPTSGKIAYERESPQMLRTLPSPPPMVSPAP